jgi:hypothetical protein
MKFILALLLVAQAVWGFQPVSSPRRSSVKTSLDSYYGGGYGGYRTYEGTLGRGYYSPYYSGGRYGGYGGYGGGIVPYRGGWDSYGGRMLRPDEPGDGVARRNYYRWGGYGGYGGYGGWNNDSYGYNMVSLPKIHVGLFTAGIFSPRRFNEYHFFFMSVVSHTAFECNALRFFCQ